MLDLKEKQKANLSLQRGHFRHQKKKKNPEHKHCILQKGWNKPSFLYEEQREDENIRYFLYIGITKIHMVTITWSVGIKSQTALNTASLKSVKHCENGATCKEKMG